MDWEAGYSVGIEEIDTQHKQLLKLFTAIERAFHERKSWSDTHHLLLELNEFVRFHFAFEEALMRLFSLPELDDHRNEHRRFFVMIEDIERSSLQLEAEARMVDFLRSWLKDHIQGSDRQYARRILAGAPVTASVFA